MVSFSMTTSDLRIKYHWPHGRCDDLSADGCDFISLKYFIRPWLVLFRFQTSAISKDHLHGWHVALVAVNVNLSDTPLSGLLDGKCQQAVSKPTASIRWPDSQADMTTMAPELLVQMVPKIRDAE